MAASIADSHVYAFGVDAAGIFSAVSGSPFAPSSGRNPVGTAITRDSRFLYSDDSVTGKLLAFLIHSDGSLSAVSGSPSDRQRGGVHGALRMRPQRLWLQCFIEDEGRPLEVGLQELASNHLKLRGSRVHVVSVEEKAEANSVR